jgi:hypothetical protein
MTVADHTGRAVKGMNCLRPLGLWDYGSNSTLDMDVYVRLFCVCSR